ncbi:uncharacterized protein N7483_005194 [Penicillium malachiteum]|uniref:uncharacterized protein n=1 Tax=Penicillium malachiteum TaxID=1324776 RepID=UPI002546EC26|nr:uncharacterized protein N7483_005194 [Penicillium malachiteum]KAJ5730686.1 hypothetical protein N7483_005194 [Penicillium malachiteum]
MQDQQDLPKMTKDVKETHDKPDAMVGDMEIFQDTRVPKGYRVAGFTLPAYRAPITQCIIIAFVHLLVVGMFNVLSALGGGGQVDPTTSNNANTILYSLFCAFALVSGSVCNFLGPKVTLAAGGIGYSLLSASYWSYNNNSNQAFVYFGGAMCGVAAAFLWTAEGSMIMSLPLEKDKGKYVGIFYGLSFFGTVIGAIIPTVENWGVTTAGSVNDSTYIALFVLMLMGSVVACFVSNPSKVIRDDGSRVVVPRQTTFVQELKNVVLAYIPYQSNDFNSYFFNLRTRAFGSLWFDFGQFAMAVILGLLLDFSKLGGRRRRAFVGWGILFFLINAVFIGGVFPARASHRGVSPEHLLDVHDEKAAGYITLYTFYGAVDGAWQTFAWWIMGALSNDPLVLSIYSAFYKVFGAMGAAIVFSLDVRGISYQAMFGSYWGLLAGSMVFVLVLIFKRVEDTLEVGGIPQANDMEMSEEAT